MTARTMTDTAARKETLAVAKRFYIRAFAGRNAK